MHIFITIVHVMVCVILILVVLLQAGKGANMGAAFGGSSQTVFGSGGAGTFLGKLTTIVAAVFMVTSLTLSYFSVSRGSSIMNTVSRPVAKKAAPAPQPAIPAAPVLPPSAGAAKGPAAPIPPPGAT